MSSPLSRSGEEGGWEGGVVGTWSTLFSGAGEEGSWGGGVVSRGGIVVSLFPPSGGLGGGVGTGMGMTPVGSMEQELNPVIVQRSCVPAWLSFISPGSNIGSVE